MRRRGVVLALLAVPAVAVPALAAPATGTTTSSFGNIDTTGCATGATCTATGGMDPSGTAHVSSDYARTVAYTSDEAAFGEAGETLTAKVPPGATKATATFVWLVARAESTASSSSGRVFSGVTLSASVPACKDGCTSVHDDAPVLTTSSSDGLPGVTSGNGAPQTVTLTVTATGKLGRFVTWQTWAWAITGGTVSQLCPGGPLSCQTVAETHAGTAHAAMDATLESSTVTFG